MQQPHRAGGPYSLGRSLEPTSLLNATTAEVGSLSPGEHHDATRVAQLASTAYIRERDRKENAELARKRHMELIARKHPVLPQNSVLPMVQRFALDS